MNNNNATRLLTLNSSRIEAERLTSILRHNTGKPVRAKQADVEKAPLANGVLAPHADAEITQHVDDECSIAFLDSWRQFFKTMNTNTTRLLILNDSRSEAERLTSMLHNAGTPVRAQHVDDEEALSKLLQEKTWDMMIGLDSTTNLPPLAAIKLIRRLNKDIPVILLTEKEGTQPVVEGLKMGAVDVVCVDEDQHLLQVIQRELSNREHRELRRLAERAKHEVERRNQQLLDSSRDAIAFIEDGMLLYANDSFAELLGYKSKDDIECMPIIDIVADEDQGKIKEVLKSFLLKGTDADTQHLKFSVLTEEGEKKQLSVEIRKSKYEEELCIEFCVRTKSVDSEELEAQLETIKNQDVVTGLYNRGYLNTALENVIRSAVSQEYNSALLLIGINNFTDIVKTKTGVGSIDLVIAEIATFFKGLIRPEDTLCRFTEDSFMLLLPNTSVSEAEKGARATVDKLNNFILDIEGATMQFTYSVGISVISETGTSTDEPIEQAVKALELAREMAKENESTFNVFEPEIENSEEKDIAIKVQNAIDNGRFKLLFQPILSLRGSDKEHYEVFLRMLADDDSLIAPTEFLSVAAKIGATVKIDRWVILESIKHVTEQRKQGKNTQLIVNLSEASIMDETLAPWLAVAFKASKLPPNSIVFQTQEIFVDDHINHAKLLCNSLKANGGVFSISHFGCSMNPLAVLKQVDAAYIKLDNSFTQDLKDSTEDSGVTEVISQLHQLDKVTIVTHVDNASLLSKLWQTGVHYIQGFYIQEPHEQMDYEFDLES